MRTRQILTATVAKTRGWETLVSLLEANTQQDLAKKADLGQSLISDLKTLKTLPGRRATLLKLEKLGIPASWWSEKPRGRRAA